MRMDVNALHRLHRSSLAASLFMIINARFLGLCQVHKGLRWELGLVVLGVGRVVGRRRMPECMTEP